MGAMFLQINGIHKVFLDAFINISWGAILGRKSFLNHIVYRVFGNIFPPLEGP
jgi:hypothetical protein